VPPNLEWFYLAFDLALRLRFSLTRFSIQASRESLGRCVFSILLDSLIRSRKQHFNDISYGNCTSACPRERTVSGTKPSELHDYTIEEYQGCEQKTKRDFKVRDYVAGEAGICEKFLPLFP